MVDLRKLAMFGSIAGCALVLSACSLLPGYKSSDKTSTTTTTQEEATGESTRAAATITYSDKGFSLAEVTVRVGDSVEFKNAGTKAVQVNSAPHPTHELFPELNIGNIEAGKSKNATLTKTGTYKYHNHLNPSENGTIIVQ